MKKTIAIFQISTFTFAKWKSFMFKGKKIKFVIQNALFSYFSLNLKKTIVTFEISALNYTKNEFVTNMTNFGIGSVFLKDPGYDFSENVCPGPGLLYKICSVPCRM